MSKYIDVDPKYEIERIGGYGINYKRIYDEVMKQFESGSVDKDGDPIAYIKIHGVDVDVSYITIKGKPWKDYYQAFTPSVNRIVTAQNLYDIDFYAVINEFRLI